MTKQELWHIFDKMLNLAGAGVLADKTLFRILPLSKLAEPVIMFPQVLKNLRVADKRAVRENERVQNAVRIVGERLGKRGRVLLRESGTEPVIRVMCEAATESECEACVDEIVRVIRAEGLA